jgi:hypothetical protein
MDEKNWITVIGQDPDGHIFTRREKKENGTPGIHIAPLD